MTIDKYPAITCMVLETCSILIVETTTLIFRVLQRFHHGFMGLLNKWLNLAPCSIPEILWLGTSNQSNLTVKHRAKHFIKQNAYLDVTWIVLDLKGQVHCFSMQVVMNKCFLLNLWEKNLAQIRLALFEKNAHFNSEKRHHRDEG